MLSGPTSEATQQVVRAAERRGWGGCRPDSPTPRSTGRMKSPFVRGPAMTVETLDELLLLPADPEARMDLVKLQGSWSSVEGRREVEFTFTGRQYTVRFRDGDVYAGVFDLVPDERPRTMIMWIHDGPEEH